MTSAALLIVLGVGTAVGALVGVALGNWVDGLLLTFIAGLLGTIIAGGVRNYIMARKAGIGPDDSRTPMVVIVFAVVASLAGSSAADELTRLTDVSSPIWRCTLAGLFSAILLAMLMVTYHTNPGEPLKLRK